MKKYKRFFAFGCSFTSWHYPTWADILSWELKIPYQNWGIMGLGNAGILHRMLECDIVNKFTKDDLILVMWSSWNREDRYIQGKWQAHGNVLNNGFYDKYFIKKYWSLENDIIKNATAIIAANRMFSIAYNLSMVNINVAIDEQDRMDLTDQEQQLLDSYMPYLSNINYVPYTNTIKEKIPGFSIGGHPDILSHLQFSKKIGESIGITISDQIVEICNKFQQKIIQTEDDHAILKIGYQRLLDEYNVDWTFDRSAFGR